MNFSDIQFNDGVATIELPTLQESVEVLDIATKRPPGRPVSQHEFISLLINMFQQHVHENIASKIYVFRSHTNRVGRASDIQEASISNLMFSKVIGKLTAPPQFQGYLPRLGFTITEKGFAVSVGTEVEICSNFNMLNASVYKSYGNEKLKYDVLLRELEFNLKSYKEKHEKEIQMIDALSHVQISRPELDTFFGQLVRTAVMANYSGKTNDAILNVTQTHRLIEQSETDPAFSYENGPNAWSLLNWGTYILDGRRVSNPDTWMDDNKAWCDMVRNKFIPEFV